MSQPPAAGNLPVVDLSFVRQAAANSLSAMDEFNKAHQVARAATLPPSLNLSDTQVKYLFTSSFMMNYYMTLGMVSIQGSTVDQYLIVYYFMLTI